MVNGWFISTLIMSFAMSFSIGSNDAANGLATSYGSKAASLKYLIVFGSIFEFVGAYFLSNDVTHTLSHEVIPSLLDLQYYEQ